MTTQRRSGRRLVAGAAAAALLSLAACGGGDGDDGDGDRKDAKGTGFDAALTQVVNPSDAKGGTLRFVSTQDSDSWDPQRGYYGFMWDFSRFYTRQLVTYATKPGPAGLEIVPDLATSRAKVTNGGKTYTYTLREGITYEDGSPIRAQDVKYGIERIFATDVVSGGPPYLMQVLDGGQKYPGPYKDAAADKLGLKSVVTPDDRTIVFNLPAPNSDFEAMLAMPSGTPVPPARDKGSKYGLRPFSSGPYKFDSYDPNKSLVLVRNDKWDKASDPVRPALPDRIEVEFSTNANDADAKTLNGTYDINLAQRGLQQAARAKVLTDAKYKPHADNPSTGFIRYVAMPQTVEPFDDIECRKAVIYAADKRALQAARGGPSGGDIGTNMLPPNIPGADPDWDPWGNREGGGAPQTDKAKAALEACGKPDGFSTKIAVRQNEPAEIASAEALQESLGKVGIEAEIEKFDGSQGNAVIGAPTNVDKQGYGLIVYGWGADFQSGAGYLQPLVDSRYISENGNNNYTMTRDPSIDALFDKAAAERDPDKAAAFYTEINKKVTESAVYLPFVFDKTVNYRAERLTNVYYSDAYGKVDFVSLGVQGGS